MADALAAPAAEPAMTASEKAAVLNARGPEGAETAVGTPEEPYQLSAEKMMMDNLFILGMLFFIFYFILIRPQQKRLKIHRDLMKGLQKGNKVITSGGIIGTITKFEGDDIVVLEVSQGVKVRMARASITEVVSDKSPGESANDN